jgi:hypothetical protein
MREIIGTSPPPSAAHHEIENVYLFLSFYLFFFFWETQELLPMSLRRAGPVRQNTHTRDWILIGPDDDVP